MRRPSRIALTKMGSGTMADTGLNFTINTIENIGSGLAYGFFSTNPRRHRGMWNHVIHSVTITKSSIWTPRCQSGAVQCGPDNRISYCKYDDKDNSSKITPSSVAMIRGSLIRQNNVAYIGTEGRRKPLWSTKNNHFHYRTPRPGVTRHGAPCAALLPRQNVVQSWQQQIVKDRAPSKLLRFRQRS